VFTARYGLIPYIKQIRFPSSKVNKEWHMNQPNTTIPGPKKSKHFKMTTWHLVKMSFINWHSSNTPNRRQDEFSAPSTQPDQQRGRHGCECHFISEWQTRRTKCMALNHYFLSDEKLAQFFLSTDMDIENAASSTEFLLWYCFVCTKKLNIICHSHEGFRNLMLYPVRVKKRVFFKLGYSPDNFPTSSDLRIKKTLVK
jgi:hypothetical protein